MEYPRFYGIMVAVKNHLGTELAALLGGMNYMRLKVYHNLDHLRLRTTWELWTLWCEKARVSDEKARKSTQNEAKNRWRAACDVDAAGSNPVTPTKIGFGKQFSKPFSLISATQILRADVGFVSPFATHIESISVHRSTRGTHSRRLRRTRRRRTQPPPYERAA